MRHISINEGVDTHTFIFDSSNISFNNFGLLIIVLSTKFKVPVVIKHGYIDMTDKSNEKGA